MKIPAWAKTVAILGIIFGAFGVIGNSSRLMMPTMAKFQGDMFEQFEKIPVDTILTYEPIIDEETGDTIGHDSTYSFQTFGENDLEFNPMEPMKDMFTMEEEDAKIYMMLGYTGIVISFLFILGAIFMFFPKAFSPKLFITFVSLSLVYRLILVIITMSDFNIYMMSSSYTSIFVILTDLTLIIITILSDKGFYKGINSEEDFIEHLRES